MGFKVYSEVGIPMEQKSKHSTILSQVHVTRTAKLISTTLYHLLYSGLDISGLSNLLFKVWFSLNYIIITIYCKIKQNNNTNLIKER